MSTGVLRRKELQLLRQQRRVSRPIRTNSIQKQRICNYNTEEFLSPLGWLHQPDQVHDVSIIGDSINHIASRPSLASCWGVAAIVQKHQARRDCQKQAIANFKDENLDYETVKTQIPVPSTSHRGYPVDNITSQNGVSGGSIMNGQSGERSFQFGKGGLKNQALLDEKSRGKRCKRVIGMAIQCAGS